MDNREKILAEALHLFAAQGYEAVGVEAIARAAGVTKPTLYHYFGSKAGLLEELLQVNFLALLDAVRPALAYARDLPLTLYRTAHAYFGFARAHPEFYRMQLAMWFGPQDGEPFRAVQPWGQRQQELLTALFAAAAQDHGNMKGRQQRYAATFLGMINTMIGLQLHGLATLDDELVFKVVHQYMHGIYS
ncbi:MAG: helix-turn-helix domain-containing protein [Pseudomonadota bacterium]